MNDSPWTSKILELILNKGHCIEDFGFEPSGGLIVFP